MDKNIMSSRTQMIVRELKAYKENGETATYPIEFRGQKIYLSVIRVDPTQLLLNPKNNRLTGQLFDHPDKKIVEADPASVDAQKILKDLLSRTDKFKVLRDQLKELGQKQPGLITKDGVLVNGNTRVVALIQLNRSFVEVAVLPENVNDTDILDVEMSLQVTDLVHQDYSFTNELLLMHRYLETGSIKQLAKKMAWVRGGERKVKLHMRILDYIEEVRTLSTGNTPYSEFDSKKQHLKDLDDDYQRLKNEGEIEAAENLKWNRLCMTFLGLNKDQVRSIEPDFIDEDLIPRLDDDEGFAAKNYIETFRSEPSQDGLDDILGPSSPPSINAKKLLSEILNDNNKNDGGSNTDNDNTEIFEKISWNARRASEKIIDEQKLHSAKAEPSEVLKDARARLASIREKVPELLGTSGFKKGKFQYDLNKLREELDKLDSLLADN